MEDKMFNFFAEIFKKRNKEEEFNKKIEEGKIARIEISDNNKFSFSNYATTYSAIYQFRDKLYQICVFKNGYYYKDGDLFYKDGRINRRIIKGSNELTK